MLEHIFKKNDCDKAEHLYHKVYEPFLEGKRTEELNILEIGIFKGASLASWHDYLPNSNIYGLDIFTRLKPEDIPVLGRDRVHWLNIDTTSSEVSNSLKSVWGDIKFDMIIDDGLHTPEANGKTFLNLIEFLKDDGAFFIEDVWPLDIMSENEWKHRWMRTNQSKYNMDKWSFFEKSVSGCEVVKHDLRKPSKMPDSYIYEMRK